MSDHESRLETSGIRELSPPKATTDSTARADLHRPGGAVSTSPASDPGAEPDAEERLPAAWQPLTFRGVAAFAHARIGRLLAIQLLVALIVAATVVWFLHVTWFARGLEAIRALPATGAIENRQLSTPRTTPEPLAADNFIAFAVNVTQSASLGSASDVRVEFRRQDLGLCSLFGCLSMEYPAGYTIQFNQPELEAWWGAWRPTVIAAVIGVTTVCLFASWWILATAYAAPAWIVVFFKDRHASLLGCWKLASAALLAPALGVAAAIALYGLNGIDLLRLLILWLAHIPLGWVYVHFAIRRLPKVAKPVPTTRTNPFTDRSAPPPSPDAPRKPSNPFAAPAAESAPPPPHAPAPAAATPPDAPNSPPAAETPRTRPAPTTPRSPSPEPPPDDILNPS